MDGEDAEPKKHDAAKDASSVQNPPPVITNGGQHGKGRNGKNGSDHEHEPANVKWTDRVQAACAILLVLITGAYTFYTRNQVRAAIDAANAAKSASDTAASTLREQKREFVTQGASSARQFSAQLAKINAGLFEQNRLATAAQENLGTAKDALATSKQELVSSERPYLWVTIKGQPIYWHNFVRVDIQIANYGKSPAIHARWREKLSVFVDRKVPVAARIHRAFLAVPPYSGLGNGFIVPATGQPDAFSTAQTPKPLTAAELSYVQNSVEGWVVAGVITYSDLYGNNYSTKYCFPYYPHAAMPECDRNDIK
ncbi:MAG: hypothetical protein WB681_12205 [Candidatus Cybelea sp.]